MYYVKEPHFQIQGNYNPLSVSTIGTTDLPENWTQTTQAPRTYLLEATFGRLYLGGFTFLCSGSSSSPVQLQRSLNVSLFSAAAADIPYHTRPDHTDHQKIRQIRQT